jgi:hypothetical protein
MEETVHIAELEHHVALIMFAWSALTVISYVATAM